MKTELSLDGFSEISVSEQQQINGGIWPIVARIVAGVVIAAASELVDDWDNFKNGLQGLPEQK